MTASLNKTPTSASEDFPILNIFNTCWNGFLIKKINIAEVWMNHYRDADKSLALPGRKQATATEDFDFHVSYL